MLLAFLVDSSEALTPLRPGHESHWKYTVIPGLELYGHSSGQNRGATA